MRRLQPNAVTFILTGYPDFESSLEAIRKQVDDYLTKPADIPSLVAALKHKLQSRPPSHRVPVRRAPELIIDNLEPLLQNWMASTLEDGQLKELPLTPQERIGKLPEILRGICVQIMHGSALDLDASIAALATQHGVLRMNRGYQADLIVAESRLLLRGVSELLQQNLLGLDLSTLVPDVMRVTELIARTNEQAIRSF